MSKLLIINGRVWNGESFIYADILAENDKIIKIEKAILEPADFIYDAQNKIVTAGLVDAHMHMRGISSSQWGTQTETSCFPYGVTAACDASAGYGNRVLLDAFMVKNQVFVGVTIKNNHPDLSAVERKREIYGDKVLGIKVFYDVTGSEVWNEEPLDEIVAFAHARDLKVMVHCSNSPVPITNIIQILGKGDILTHAYHGGIHSAAEDNFKCILEAKERGVIIDVGLAGNVHIDYKVFRQAIQQGMLPDVISTDITRASAHIRGGRYGMTMCMSIARELGMEEGAIFQSVTSAPAKALGKAGEWGYLHIGRCADIAVLDYTREAFDLTDMAGNNVRSIEGYRCVLTIVDGQVVYRL